MWRRIAPAALSVLACAGPTSPTPVRAPPEPAAAAVSELADPVPAPDAAPAPAALVLDALGWQREGAQPLLRVDYYDSYGPLAETLERELLAALEPLYACYEGLDPSARLTLELGYRVRIGDGPDDGLELDARPELAADTRACLRAALTREAVESPDARSGLIARLRLFPTADAAPRLRTPSASDRTTTRLGGSCWVWEDYPCAPNKHCKADEWLRAACPPPTQHENVRLHWRLGPLDERGLGAALGLELQSARGETLWFAELEPDERARDLRLEALERNKPEPLGAQLVEWGAEQLLIVDTLGARVFDRATGQRRATWLAAPRGSSHVSFDGGEFEVRGRQRCEGDAGHGRFAARCGDVLLHFDGHTLTALDPETLEVQATTNIEAKGAKVQTDGAETRVSLRAGKLRVTIQGMTYM